MRFALSASFVLLVVACGSSEETTTDPPVAAPAAAEPEATDRGPAAEAAAVDDCTPNGYECHPYPSCKGEYMPMSGHSCGTTGGYCCIKGLMPPSK